MEQAIADADFIIALINNQDSNHPRANAVARDLSMRDIQVIINNITLYEILTVLSMKWFKRKALALYLVAQKQEMFGLVYVTRETERSAYYYFKTARSKNISFADCMLLASADEHKAYTIVSFDAHIKRNSKIIPVIN